MSNGKIKKLNDIFSITSTCTPICPPFYNIHNEKYGNKRNKEENGNILNDISHYNKLIVLKEGKENDNKKKLLEYDVPRVHWKSPASP